MSQTPCITYTHYGWFWFLPILAAYEDSGLAVTARWAWMDALWPVCDFLEEVRIRVSGWIWTDYEPTFMFALAELQEPVTR